MHQRTIIPPFSNSNLATSSASKIKHNKNIPPKTITARKQKLRRLQHHSETSKHSTGNDSKTIGLAEAESELST